MRKLKLIYNPFAGDCAFKDELDGCIEIFQRAGYDTHVFRGIEQGDIGGHISGLGPREYDAVVIAGGDGSVNIAADAMLRRGLKAALGIIPSGTANDFASFLKLPRPPMEAARVIAGGRRVKADVGEANGRYFINVCAAGLLTNVSHIVDPGFKNTFGKLAYYVKGLEQLPGFVPLPMRVTAGGRVTEEDFYWFTVLNSAGTGGFDRLAPGAEIDDGLLDFVGFKAVPLHELAILFVKMLASADYLNDERVVYFRGSEIKVEYLGGDADMLPTDLDGEPGPDMPVDIRCLKRRLDIFA